MEQQAYTYLLLIMIYLLLMVGVYLIASIPSGYILIKALYGTDIRNSGSGNIGATNVTRTYGKKIGIATFLLDIAKAWLCFLLAYQIYRITALLGGISLTSIFAICLFFVTFGHCYSIWLKFQGGKGVSVFLGALLFINPVLFLNFIVVWVCLFLLFKISSLAALSASSITLLIGLVFLPFQTGIALSLSVAIIFWRHCANIKQLLAGSELSFKNK